MAALAHSADAPRARDGGGGGVAEDSRALALSRTKYWRQTIPTGVQAWTDAWTRTTGSLGLERRRRCSVLADTPSRRPTQENRLLIITGTKEGIKEGSKAPQARERGCLAWFRFCTGFFSLQCVWFLSSTDQEEWAGVLGNILEGSPSVVCEFIWSVVVRAHVITCFHIRIIHIAFTAPHYQTATLPDIPVIELLRTTWCLTPKEMMFGSRTNREPNAMNENLTWVRSTESIVH